MALTRYRVKTVADLGLLLRAVRRSSGLRLDDMAGCAGVGHVFAREVEHGKETVQMGRVLKLLDEMGLHLTVDIPEPAVGEYDRLRETGLRPLKMRRRPKNGSEPR